MRLAAWNHGPNVRKRHQAAFMANVDVTEAGHWLWTGRRNFAGTPVVALGTMLAAAAPVAAELFRGKRLPASFERACPFEACVNPACWRRPKPAESTTRRKPKAPSSARPPRRAATEPAAPPDGPTVALCGRGLHDMSVTRRRTPNGKSYCHACKVAYNVGHVRDQRGGADHRLKDTCTRGHDMAATRRRTPKGKTYCSQCVSERAQERKARANA